MASTSGSEPTSWTLPEGNCDKCGAPSSWADDWTQDLSWIDNAKLQKATYFASPRMWPLGYILGSNYSPLNLEHQFPNFNWRDRFEDLLAFESGKKMISAVSRQNEALTASRIHNETVHYNISHVNQELQRNREYVLLLQSLRELADHTKDNAIVSQIDNLALPYQKKSAEMTIAHGKALISSLQDLQKKPASSYKERVPWITSLISSVYDSADGWHAGVFKADPSGDGQLFTEKDLTMIFKKGYRMDFRRPLWSTAEGSYNDYRHQIENRRSEGDAADPDVEHTYNTIESHRPTILSQLTTVERRKSWNGSIETRVVLKNRFADGKEEEKTIVNNASKVLEEVEKVHASVKERHIAVHTAIWELGYRKQKEMVTFAKEQEDQGVE